VTAPIARFAGFGVRYGRTVAVAGVGFEIGRGDRLGMIGESGSGKSTLALALAGLLPAEATVSGRIDWHLDAAGAVPLAGRDIGTVFQNPGGSFDPVIAIGEQIAEVIVTHRGGGWSAARRRAVMLLDAVRLPEPARIARAFPHELSGGQRQRAALAVALAAGPAILVADEATSALDTVVAAEIVALIDGLVEDTGLTLVFVSHDIALAARISRRLAVVYGGGLAELGPTDRLIAAPRHPYTAALIAAHLDLDTLGRRRLPTIAGAPPGPDEAIAGCRFAPRCPRASAACAAVPAWSGDGRSGFACHHPLPDPAAIGEGGR
jgi:peptide/nickel transport system ATP-binding protein